MGFGFAVLVALSVIMRGLERLGNDIATCIFSAFPPNAILKSKWNLHNKLHGCPTYPESGIQMILKTERFFQLIWVNFKPDLNLLDSKGWPGLTWSCEYFLFFPFIMNIHSFSFSSVHVFHLRMWPQTQWWCHVIYSGHHHFKIWKAVKFGILLDLQSSDKELQICKRLHPHCHWKLQQVNFCPKPADPTFSPCS